MARVAAAEPVRTILSGPAGGVVGATHAASVAGNDDIITFDMGGTSTDVALCDGAVPTRADVMIEVFRRGLRVGYEIQQNVRPWPRDSVPTASG